MTLKERYLRELSKKISRNGKYHFGQYLTLKDIKQILRAFEELEEKVRELERGKD